MTSIDLQPEHWQEKTVVLRQLCVYRRRSCYKSSFNLSMKLELKHKSFELWLTCGKAAWFAESSEFNDIVVNQETHRDHTTTLILISSLYFMLNWAAQRRNRYAFSSFMMHRLPVYCILQMSGLFSQMVISHCHFLTRLHRLSTFIIQFDLSFFPQSLTLLLNNHNMRHLFICTAHYFRTLRGNFVEGTF